MQIDTPASRRACGQIYTGIEAVRDPRIFQILFLGVLLAAGSWTRDFAIHREQIALTFAAALTTQALCSWLGGKPLSFRSAIITSLGLSVLLRADNLWAHPAAAAAAIGSKSVIRIRGKHLFNPANLGVMFAMCAMRGAWVSGGQWGSDIALAGWLVVLGALVADRARSSDISWSFLGFHLGLLATRVVWLGQRWAVWTHQLQSGALLLFAFFMISDPMTIPNHRRGRIAHAALVSAIAYVWQFELYRSNALLWALMLAAPAVPIWDAIWTARKYEWITQGEQHENRNMVESTAVCGGPRRVAVADGIGAVTRHAA